MKWFVVPAVLSMTVAQAIAGWIAIEKPYQPTGIQTVYFDPESIYRKNAHATIWQLTDIQWNSTTRFRPAKFTRNLIARDRGFAYCK